MDIDYILDLIDLNNSEENQQKGIKLAKKVKCINAFFRPFEEIGKSTWQNCAIILSQRSDEELFPYLYKMLEWIDDLNWPGAFTIFNRLSTYKMNDFLDILIEIYIEDNKKRENNIGVQNLIDLKKIRNKNFKNVKLPNYNIYILNKQIEYSKKTGNKKLEAILLQEKSSLESNNKK